MNKIVQKDTDIDPDCKERSLCHFIHHVLHNERGPKEYWYSYPQWAKGGDRAWMPLREGGTGIMRVLMWYHHVHKPGSKEWRPKIIIKAVKEEYQKWLSQD